MKKQERYKILNYAKNQYSQTFNRDYQFKFLSKKALYKLLHTNKHSSMCEWNYCCYGLYQNCWQEPIEEGNWGLTQKQVNENIKYTINGTAKACRKDSRILYCKTEKYIHVVIVMRDICKTDYLICFTNDEGRI